MGHGASGSWCSLPTSRHHPQGSLLRGQLRPFLDGFFQSSEQVIVCIMDTVSDMLHRLGAQGAGSQSLSVAISARSFFNDVSTGAGRGYLLLTPFRTLLPTQLPSSAKGGTPSCRQGGPGPGELPACGPQLRWALCRWAGWIPGACPFTTGLN